MAPGLGTCRVLALTLLSPLLLAMQEREERDDEYPGHLWEARWGDFSSSSSARPSPTWNSTQEESNQEASVAADGGTETSNRPAGYSYHDYTVYMAQTWDAELCHGLQSEELHGDGLLVPDPSELPMTIFNIPAAPAADELVQQVSSSQLQTPDQEGEPVDWLQVVGDHRRLRGRRSVFETYVPPEVMAQSAEDEGGATTTAVEDQWWPSSSSTSGTSSSTMPSSSSTSSWMPPTTPSSSSSSSWASTTSLGGGG